MTPHKIDYLLNTEQASNFRLNEKGCSILLYMLFTELHNYSALCHHKKPKFEKNINRKSGGNKYFKISDSLYVPIE